MPTLPKLLVGPQDVAALNDTLNQLIEYLRRTTELADSIAYVVPSDGATLTALMGLAGYILDPAARLATLNIVLPLAQDNLQPFSISSTQPIGLLTVTGAGGASVKNGVFAMSAGSGVRWQFIASQNSWFASP